MLADLYVACSYKITLVAYQSLTANKLFSEHYNQSFCTTFVRIPWEIPEHHRIVIAYTKKLAISRVHNIIKEWAPFYIMNSWL